MLYEAGLTNLGPSCALREVRGMGWAQPQSWAPPRTFGNCPVLGGKHSRQEDGSGFRSFLRVRRVQLGFPAWLSLTLRLRSRALQGLPVGRGAAAQGSFAAVRFGALALGGGAPGFSLRLRGGRSMPPTQPRVGARAPGGLRAGRGSSQTSPQVGGSDPRGTAGAPALCAPAPAAQLLTMTSSHLPQSARTSPRVWGAGEGGCVRKFPPGAAGRCSPCTN